MNRRECLRIVIPMLQYHPSHPSGSTRLAFDEASYLADLGHDVWVVTQDLDRSGVRYSFENNLHVVRYDSPRLSLFDPRRMSIHQRLSRDALSFSLKGPVDAVHGHSLLQYDAALERFGGQARTCYSVHSPILLELQAEMRGAPILKRLSLSVSARLTHRIERRCLDRSDRVLAVSAFTRGLMGPLYGTSVQRRTQVVPGWADVANYRIQRDRAAVKGRLGWPTDVPVLLTLRRLVPRMGLDRLLYAARELASLDLRFHLVLGGQGPLRPQLEELAGRLKLRSHISFAGRVPEPVLPLMYGAADAFVLPTSELECFGLTIVESLACGRPVLATPVGAIPEILNRIEPAWLAADGRVESITHLLKDFLRDSLPAHEPDTLREFVTRHYSKEAILPQLTKAVYG